MTHEFRYRRRVEFAETDTAGVAHFAAFFRWMEEAEHALYRSVGGSAYRSDADRVEGMPRSAASCEYRRPVRYGDELEVRLVVREMTERSIAYDVEFRRMDEAGDAGGSGDEGELVALGSMRVVHVVRPHGALEWRVTELPSVLREALEPAPAGTV
ncbi:MAG: acyl-CoA thioesterase [Gemmatimonadota bacterium]